MDSGDRAGARQHVFLLPGKHARPGRRRASPGLLPARPGPARERADRPTGTARGRTCTWSGGARPPSALGARDPTRAPQRVALHARNTGAGALALRAPRTRVPDGIVFPKRCSSFSCWLQLAAVFTTQIRKRRNGRSLLILLGWAAGLRGTTWAQGLAARCEAR